jgi:tRNA threonylcarbamoyladenosine biosynthesis protein TsaE
MTRLLFEAISDSEGETIGIGQRFGAALRSRAVVGLTGPLGAGKTRIVQGIARGSGYVGRVRSPTFALLHLYRGRLLVRHFDFYRLDSVDDGTAGEWEEEMDADGVSLIEWADRIPDLLPQGAIWIDLSPEGPYRRRIRIRVGLPSRALDHWRLL